MTLADLHPKRAKRDDGTSEKVLVLKVAVEPFTPEMAADLNVRSRLFTSSGEAHPDVLNASLSIAPGPQKVEFYRAPDPDMPVSVVLRAVKVERSLAVRKDKETNLFNATLTLVTHMPSAKDTLAFFEGHAEQWFLTFEREQGDMLDSIEQAEAKPRRLRKGVSEDQPALPTAGGEQAAV